MVDMFKFYPLSNKILNNV